MEETELTTLLGSHDLKQSSRTWRCPDENELAAYVNGQPMDRQKLERHLADCKPCRQTTALLVAHFDPNEAIPPAVLARARSLGGSAHTVKWNWGWTVAAATACLLIVASVVLWKFWSVKTVRPSTELVAKVTEAPLPGKESVATVNPSAPVQAPHVEKPKPGGTQAPLVRGSESGPKLTLVFPREGSLVHLPLQTLRWLPVPDATFYEIKIVTEDGAAVVTQTTNNPELLLATDTLRPGSKYFVTVIAHLVGNRTIRSGLVKFRTAEVR
jgi:hypothetical protein